MANELTGAQRFITAWSENLVWGTKPASPSSLLLPVETCNISTPRDRRNNKPYFGSKKKKHSRGYRGMPTGNLGGALHGYWPFGLAMSIAQWLLEMAFDHGTSMDLKSFGVEDANGPNVSNKQFNGLRFNTFSLQGSEQSGRVDWSGAAMGKSEVDVATTGFSVPSDLEKLLDFEFPDVTMEFDLAGGTSYTEYPVQSFTLARNNMLRASYLAERTPSHLKSMGADTGLQVVRHKNDKVWDAFARTLTADTEISGRLTLLGLHNGSGGSDDYTQVVITMPRLVFLDPTDQDAVEDYKMQTLAFDLLKPDTASEEISIAYATV